LRSICTNSSFVYSVSVKGPPDTIGAAFVNCRIPFPSSPSCSDQTCSGRTGICCSCESAQSSFTGASYWILSVPSSVASADVMWRA
jgi:hypothetical protein